MSNAFSWFEKIAQIPHMSYHEQALSDYIVAFAKARNLKVIQDKAGNVVVFKPASSGYESAATTILQAHLDMVAEKNKSSNHDFLVDPIEIQIVDGEVYANQTTLGGDDGVGVAYMLAILDDDALVHPALECVFTVQEEVGLKGAMAFDASILTGVNFIGLDSSGESTTVVSSSGGSRSDVIVPVHFEINSAPVLEVFISGLRGGHSGGSIDLQRANSLKLAGILLYQLAKKHTLRLVAIDGGLKENAIAREATLQIACLEDTAGIIDSVHQITSELKAQYHSADPDLSITVHEIGAGRCMDEASTIRVANLLFMLPYGSLYRELAMDNLVVASSNYGVVTTDEENVSIHLSTRAAQAFVLNQILDQIALLAQLNSSVFTLVSIYGGWPYADNSPLRERLFKVYEELRHQPMSIEATHGGLEMGVFKGKLPHLDMISLGPITTDIHTPNEHFNLASFERTYEVLVHVIQDIGHQR